MILQETYYDDLLDCINSTPDTVFWRRRLNKKLILQDHDLIDKLWTEYQSQIEKGVDANYAYAFTLENILHIQLSKWEPIFHKYIENMHSELYG